MGERRVSKSGDIAGGAVSRAGAGGRPAVPPGRTPGLAPGLAVGLALLAGVLALGLQGLAVYRQSLTMDEPYHLLAGHQALRYGQNTLNLEHPPLVKMVAALPLLVTESPPPAADVRRAGPLARAQFRHPEFVSFVRPAARILVLLVFALPAVLAWAFLGRRLFGAPTGLTLGLILGLSFDLVPYWSQIQTDAALALGCAVTLLGAVGLVERGGWRPVLWMGAGLGLSLAVKLSGVLLLPTVLLAAAWARPRNGGEGGSGGIWRFRGAALAVALLLGGGLLWTTYRLANWNYDPVVGRETIRHYTENRGTLVVEDRMRGDADLLLAVEKPLPMLAQWLTGLVGVRRQNELAIYSSYAFGQIHSEGRWWYFPAVWLVKTPLVLLAATALWAVGAAGAAARKVREGSWGRAVGGWLGSARGRAEALLVLTAGVVLAAAMTSNYNIGLRHLIPVLPLTYLPASRWLAGRPRALTVAVGLLALEAVLLAPHWMAATNTWWLGSHNPTRFALCCSDGENKQNLVELASELESRGVDRVVVLLPGSDTRELSAYLPGAQAGDPMDGVGPGWYAVSIQIEQYLPAVLRASPETLYDYTRYHALAVKWKPYWEAIRAGEDHGYVAGTFHLYRLPG